MPYVIQGQSPPLPREPVEINGTLYVPLKDVTETLGGTVDCDEDNIPTATISRWAATLPPDEARTDVNGVAIPLSAPPVDQDGSVWVPIDFFHSAFGYEVETDGTAVFITNPNTG